MVMRLVYLEVEIGYKRSGDLTQDFNRTYYS